jgi:diguanylate cyclase (GGDEF)-like protein/PAS domain S-box-containing protein
LYIKVTKDVEIMREQLKMLIAINSEDYIKLVLRELKKSGYDIIWKKADSKIILSDFLHNEQWDLILSEDNINDNLNIYDILKIKNEMQIEIPLILVCENIKSESLLQIIKNGCSNCVFKSNLSSIGSIVMNELYSSKLKYEKEQEINRIRKDYDALVFDVKRYKLAVEGSNDGIWDWDTINDRAYISFKWKEMLNIKSCEFENFGGVWLELIHPEDLNILEEAITSYFQKKTPYFICEYRLKTKDNDYIWVLTRGKAIRDNEGNIIKMAGSHTNITDKKRAEEKINHLAYFDTVTNLANRTLFEERLNKCIADTNANKEMFGLIYLDIDNFKNVNDTLGHAFGDLLLKNMANLLKKHVNKEDTVARLSGDEFSIIIPRLKTLEKVNIIADKIKGEFQNPFMLANHEVYVTVSMGIAIYPTDGEDQQTLLKNADTAMYCAKEKGKNSYEFYLHEMNIKVMEKLQLQNDLRRAIKNNEFVVYYQPQVSMETSEIVGFEALVRWIHPAKGLISPLKFIPEAEEMGLIADIGEFVLRTACKQNKHWQELGYSPKCMAVNLSARQFQQKNLLKVIEDVLAETQLDTKLLELEITESICMNDLKFTIDLLNKFNEMGVTIALDDFGTGYSSLNYLKKLPLQSLKIDKSFVDNITNDDKELAIAKAITTLAHTLNLSIVAEGVETEDQFSVLKELNCDTAQGYLFSRPLPAEEIERLLVLVKGS